MRKPVVLDASALIAAIYGEDGADIVERHLPTAVISSVNLTEVASYMIREGVPAAETRELLESLSLDVAVYDSAQAFLAAELFPKTAPRGLSLGDRACLALAITRGLTALTADRAWKSLDHGAKVEVIR